MLPCYPLTKLFTSVSPKELVNLTRNHFHLQTPCTRTGKSNYQKNKRIQEIRIVLFTRFLCVTFICYTSNTYKQVLIILLPTTFSHLLSNRKPRKNVKDWLRTRSEKKKKSKSNKNKHLSTETIRSTYEQLTCHII